AACGPQSDAMVVTFNAMPPAPTAAGAIVCLGSSATLTASAPGGTYQWYDAAVNGNLLSTGPVYTTPALIANTTYYLQTTIGGVTSNRTAVLVKVNGIPPAPTALGMPVCSGSTATLTASGSAGTYEWYDAPVGGNLLSINSTYTTTFLTANTSYYVQSIVNGCPGTRTKVDVTVNAVPIITSLPAGSTCSGNALNYTITSNIPAATFNWSRAAVAGISNPAVVNQLSGTITETLVNTGTTAVNVTYVITPTANGCPGTPFNYVVTVNPTPAVTSKLTDAMCSGTSDNYTIVFNTPGVAFNWSRVAVPGISNSAVNGQTAATIREVLFNTTNAPIDVTYVFNYSIGGCPGVFNFVVTVNPPINVTSLDYGTACSGTTQNYVITSNIPTTTFTWSRTAVPGVSNPSVSGQVANPITETLINTTTLPVRVNYIITPAANGCTGPQLVRSILVDPLPPKPIANANSPVCVGSTIHLQTPVVPNATYSWSGPNGFTSASQNPNIQNVTLANSGTYSLFITTANGCSSLVSTVDVVVDPPPIVNAGPDQPVCHNVASVQLAGSVNGGTKTGLWSTNGTGTFSPSSSTLNALYIPSAQDRAAGLIKLTLASTSKDDCSIGTSVMNIKFVTPTVTSAPTGVICTSTAQNYVITANTPTATYSWDRAAVAGISNPAVANQTSGTINETLVNTTPAAVPVVYIITPSDNGCPGTPFTYTVTVDPSPATPTASANSPVCVGTVIHLTTPTILNATYAWTGPAGFTSASQNPDVTTVTTASAGTYHVVVFVNGCPSPAGSVNVVVDQPPVANAGQDKLVCPTTASVQLAGSVTGGTNTGTWSTSGTGTFSPSNTTLFAKYLPSAQDQASGSVTLTLASTSNDNCNISTSTMNITFHLLPAVDAGSNQSICSENAAILHGVISIAGGGVWSTSGTGTFSPSASQLDATYYPSPADIKSGSVTLTLTANNAGQCYIPTDAMTVTIMPPPTVNAGGTRYVLKGNKITLDPVVSDNNVQYSWSPDIDISSTTIKNPIVTGTVDRVYTLTVTDERGCVSSDKVSIKVSPEILLPNAFTPNGDGVNDLWNVQGLIAYQNATVDVFDRYGQKVFHSVGYGQPWDGTSNGKVLPFGTYYYIIDTKMNGIVLSGYVTIVK
ncbi:MAG: Ig-like domain-containing protein, partial [Mucilaginibacter sp.]